ncbi:uncharacterized protein LOC116026724 isoform X1 [Ipomoea triloba]|uniref:uncharacterized protein LOC116026724 isoform X1 n=1 Tax=Ipomoea triloba TaxID=35885 RepID=UPI00125E1ABC|nr:uncharacterized protein LOC116026724 isoform X1 [Ipomoea triloba]
MESSLSTPSPSLPPFPRRLHSHSPLISSFPAIFTGTLRLRKIAPSMATATASCSSQPPLLSARTVSISYTELKDKNADLSSKIEQGFGANGLGLVSISDVPEYTLLRENLLRLSSRLANVSEDVKRELEDPDSRYSFGWSYGRQMRDGKLGKNGQSIKLDKLKASFYANPILDVPTTEPSLLQQYPSFCRANIWPCTALPELEIAFKALGKLIVNVGLLLAYHCDRYVSSRIATNENKDILHTLLPSRSHKGRLLHYFPTQNSCSAQDDGSIPSWAGWHTDCASFTGLTCEMFTRDDVEIPCPDNAAGLYIKSRTGQVVKPEYGEDEIAYMAGETSEILSRHLLCATPHCVQAPKGAEASAVGRSTFALFLQPDWDDKFNFSELAHIHEELRHSNHPQTFGEYNERLLDKYY